MHIEQNTHQNNLISFLNLFSFSLKKKYKMEKQIKKKHEITIRRYKARYASVFG